VRAVRWNAGLDPRVLPGLLGELRRSNSLLHAHDGHALTLAGIAAGLSRTPLVVTRRVTFPLRSTYLWARAQRVIAISGAVRASLLNDGLPPERVVVIPSAVDAAGLERQRGPDIRARFGLPADGSVAVSLGSLSPDKDPCALIEAAAQLVRDLPRLHWVLVGEGSLRAMLEARIAEYGLQDRVHLVGTLDEPHLALAGADVFVLSSMAEGLGSSVLAAMAMGVPVVATRVGGVPEVLGSDAGILVPAQDPIALAAAVRQVLTEPKRADELVRCARTRVQAFTPDAIARQVAAVYRSFAHSLDGS
jgi:glycosyltransferase involved in cell wall biosynthesis